MESYKTKPADTPDEIKRQKSVRKELNDKLMALLLGETGVIPPFQFTNLPDCPNEPWRMADDKEHDDFIDKVQGIKHASGNGDARKRVQLREQGVIVPREVPILEEVDRYREIAAMCMAKIHEHRKAGGCLWHFFPYRQLLGLKQFLEMRQFDFDLTDLLAEK